MEEKREDYYALNDIVVSITSFLQYLSRKWVTLLVIAIAGAILGTGYYFIQKSKYDATTTFILEEKSSGGGGLAGLASQFGFDVGSLTGGGSIFAGDNILEILLSKKIIYKALLSPVDSQANKITLADLFLEFSGWKAKWAGKEDLKNINYQGYRPEQLLTTKQDSVLSLIHTYLLKKAVGAERVNKKGSIIRFTATASNSQFARLLTERVVTEAAKLYIDIKTSTAQANIAQMQHRADSLLNLLNRKSYSVAANQPLDVNPGIKEAIVPGEINSRDKTIIATVYSEVTKNLEASKLMLSQQTPVIQLLDQPGYSLEDHKKKLPALLFGSAVAAALFYIMISFLIFQVKFRKKMTA